MKLIGRTFAILAAALLVVGALVAFSPSGSATGFSGEMPQAAAIQTSGAATDTTSGAASATTAASMPQHEHGMSNTPSLGAIFEVLKNLVVVGVITLIVALGKRLLGRTRGPGNSGRRPQAPPSVA